MHGIRRQFAVDRIRPDDFGWYFQMQAHFLQPLLAVRRDENAPDLALRVPQRGCRCVPAIDNRRTVFIARRGAARPAPEGTLAALPGLLAATAVPVFLSPHKGF